jgi:hypothetical protein|tara:strand:- start:179 stop:691 length:513 start_codon:yes stop_codon:yes gene_type:complete
MNIIFEKIPIFLKNKEKLTNFFKTGSDRFYKDYEYVRNGGKSSFDVWGKLHQQLPSDIIDNLTSHIIKVLKNKYKFIDMWTNTHPSQAYTARHNHFDDKYPISISGTYYLKKPKNSGNIVFDEEGVVNVEENDLLVFHQFKDGGYHWTESNNSNEDRIVISFNMEPNESK